MLKHKVLTHTIAEAVEFAYTVKPGITVNDLSFTQKLNRRVQQEVVQVACDDGLAVPFTFAIGEDLLHVEVTPLTQGVRIDPERPVLPCGARKKSPAKTGNFSPVRSSTP